MSDLMCPETFSGFFLFGSLRLYIYIERERVQHNACLCEFQPAAMFERMYTTQH